MKVVVRLLSILLKTLFWLLLALVVFLVSLFFRSQRLPASLLCRAAAAFLPETLVLHVERASFGFMDGFVVSDFRLYDRTRLNRIEPLVSADEIAVMPVQRRVVAKRLMIKHLHDGYYEPGNSERNAPVDFAIPDIPHFALLLDRPDILSVAPSRVTADVFAVGNRLCVDNVRIDWFTAGETAALEGRLTLDFAVQELVGEVHGDARQQHIRPLLETIDVPSALPYIDGFTGVQGAVPSTCSWKVNLVNNDFDMELGLHPKLGEYNQVPLQRADGKLRLHVYTRGENLNYTHTFGPITALGATDHTLEGIVEVEGTNGFNTVRVTAKSALPVADLIRIGGFEGDYVDRDVYGDSECSLVFRFPRDMGDDKSKLNGEGHLSIRNGQLMRLKGFAGLLELLAEKVPGFSLITDSTQASCDYVIENGIVKSDNVYIEGSVFSIKMYGYFDSVNERLDYTARVQFTKQDSVMGKIIHPLTWPFTKLLLEFRLRGTSDEPKWEYISVIDRVIGGD